MDNQSQPYNSFGSNGLIDMPQQSAQLQSTPQPLSYANPVYPVNHQGYQASDSSSEWQSLCLNLISHIQKLHSKIIDGDLRTHLSVEDIKSLHAVAGPYFPELEDSSYFYSLSKLCHYCRMNQSQAKIHERCYFCIECLHSLSSQGYLCICSRPISHQDLHSIPGYLKFVGKFLCLCGLVFDSSFEYLCKACSKSMCWSCLKDRELCFHCQGKIEEVLCFGCKRKKNMDDICKVLCENKHLLCNECAEMSNTIGYCIADSKEFPSKETPGIIRELEQLQVNCLCCCKEGRSKYLGEARCMDNCDVCLKCQTLHDLKNLKENKPLSCVYCDSAFL